MEVLKVFYKIWIFHETDSRFAASKGIEVLFLSGFRLSTVEILI